MNSVKKSLASLCTYLNLLFDIDISTEDFRLAKFNKTEDKIVSNPKIVVLYLYNSKN